MKNISFQILKNSSSIPDNIAISTLSDDITYGLLEKILWAFAIRMKMNGIDSSSCVAIQTYEPIKSICSILALGMIGASWVRATPKALSNTAINITHLLYTEGMQSIKEVTSIKIDGTWLSDTTQSNEAIHSHGIRGNHNDTDIWMIAQSSGTTGNQKFMALSYENYWNRNKKTSLTHDFYPVITACLFPSLSGAWVSYNLRTLGSQGTLVFGESLDFFIKMNVQKVFGSPKQFDGFLKKYTQPLQDRLPIAHIAGASISKGFTEKIFQHFNVIHNFYGATEVGGIARKVISVPTEETANVGQILAGNHVEIVDEMHKQLPNGVEGLIRVKNNIMVSEYLSNDKATAEFIVDGWFYTGDRGYWTSPVSVDIS